MIIVKSSSRPCEEVRSEMVAYNEELAKAGVLVALRRLEPDSKGARIRFSGGKHSIVDGPFTESKEVIGGYWLWNVKSKDEAIEWVKRCPMPSSDAEFEFEVRQVLEDDPLVASIVSCLKQEEPLVQR
jgi:hypothetical protein